MSKPRISPTCASYHCGPSAQRAPKPFDGSDWLFEMKYDGYRGLPYLEHGKPG